MSATWFLDLLDSLDRRIDGFSQDVEFWWRYWFGR